MYLCIDYWRLNKATIKNKYPLSHIYDLFDEIQGALIFPKIFLQFVYYQLKIKASDILNMAFRTWYGYYEFLVMSFGMTNAPRMFMELMHMDFQPYLNNFVIVFINDLLVYYKNESMLVRNLKAII